jgi:hypothetical protein
MKVCGVAEEHDGAGEESTCKKKVSGFPVPNKMSLTKLSLAGISPTNSPW